MLYAIVTVLALIIDQAVKYWVTLAIELDVGTVTVIPGILSLTNIHNTGAAFGILENARWLFVILAIVFVVLVVVALSKNIIRSPLGRWSAVLVTAGALGNCIDRIMQGYVVDMFRLDFFPSFAVFNVADILITVCGILFCVYIIFGSDFKSGEEKAKQPKAPKKGGKVSAAGEPKQVKPAPAAAPAPTPFKPAQSQQDNRSALPRSRPAGAGSPYEAIPNTDRVPTAARPERTPPPTQKAPRHESEDFSLEDILAEYSGK